MISKSDSLLGIECEISIESTEKLRARLMAEHQLTDVDLFFNFVGDSLVLPEFHYCNLQGAQSHTRLFPELYLSKDKLQRALQIPHPGQTTRKIVGTKTLESYAKELGFDDSFQSYDELVARDESCAYLDCSELIYEEISYDEGLREVLNYGLIKFNEQRQQDTLVSRQIIENGTVILNETTEGTLELIDGFYRVLYKTVPATVVVKTYRGLTDIQWTQLMVNANYWKTNHRDLFYDRGFLLGLQTRYRLNSLDYQTHQAGHLGRFLEIYIRPLQLPATKIKTGLIEKKVDSRDFLFYMGVEEFRRNILTTPTFYEDLKQLKTCLGFLPSTILKHRNLKVINPLETQGYSQFLSLFIPYVFTFRFLHQQESMAPISTQLLEELFQEKVFADAFAKSCKMSVSGHIENLLGSFLPYFKETFERYLLEAGDSN